MKTITLQIALMFLAGLILQAVTAEPATVVNKTDLKKAPQFQAEVVQQLDEGQQIDIIRRQRAWYLVNAKQLEGWINMLSVRYDIEPINQRSTSLLSVLGLKQGHDNITATTGVRGIDAADIKAASPNFEGLLFAQKYQESTESATNFAQAASLVSKKITYPEVSDEND